MPTIQVEAEISGDDLLKAARQLSGSEFDRFVSALLTLRAERQAPRLSAEETRLLTEINQALPESVQRRYTELMQRRRDETLTPEEHAELIQLTDQVEMRQAARVGALVELAQLRNTSLAKLESLLGIRGNGHG